MTVKPDTGKPATARPDRATEPPTGVEPKEWLDRAGAVLDCDEKLMALRENIGEINDIVREALEDAVLMEVDEQQFRDTLKRLVDALESPYAKK